SNGAAWRDAKRHAVECGRSVAMREADVLERDLPPWFGNGLGWIRLRNSFARMAENLVDSAYRYCCLAEFRQDPAHHANGPDEHIHGGEKKEKPSDTKSSTRERNAA